MIFDAKHEMIRKLVRQFAETELTTEVLDKVEETGEFPEEIVDKMAKCGFLGLKIPREYGGAGADTLAYVIMIEEIARVSAVASLYANTPNSLGGGPLMQAGTPEQLEKYLRPSVENKVKIVFGLTEWRRLRRQQHGHHRREGRRRLYPQRPQVLYLRCAAGRLLHRLRQDRYEPRQQGHLRLYRGEGLEGL